MFEWILAWDITVRPVAMSMLDQKTGISIGRSATLSRFDESGKILSKTLPPDGTAYFGEKRSKTLRAG